MPSIEFPANVYPWLALEKRGVRIKFVQPRDGRVTAEMLAGACTARTRCVTVSFVQFSNGYRDRRRASSGASAASAASTFTSTASSRSGCSGATCGRWRSTFSRREGTSGSSARRGRGFFYCRRELLDELDIWNPGWLGVEDAWNFTNFRQAVPRRRAPLRGRHAQPLRNRGARRLDRTVPRDRHGERGEENPRARRSPRGGTARAGLPRHEPPRARRAIGDSLLPPPARRARGSSSRLRRARRREPSAGSDQTRAALLQHGEEVERVLDLLSRA